MSRWRSEQSREKTQATLAEFEKRMDAKVREAVLAQLTSSAAFKPVAKSYPTVAKPAKQRRILVTGGAGFVGSNLVDVLMMQGHVVYVLDNLYTGHRKNIEHWIGHPNFTFFQGDVTQPFYVEVDDVYHLACPASPPHYQRNAIKTIKVGVLGTLNMLGLAKRCNARFLLTSTSEVYGDPEVHPQTESYWGHVNCFGPRSCYDEGKRVAESLCYEYINKHHMWIRIARIFNTFGPRMDPNDGRVVSNFIIQALQGKSLTVYGDGSQTRSFQYVSDLVRGLIMLMNSDATSPVNIGNPDEYTIKQFAESIQSEVNPDAPLVYLPASQDDPKQRKPDITRAKAVLGWSPQVHVKTGIEQTIRYFRNELGLDRPTDSPVPTIWIPTYTEAELTPPRTAGAPGSASATSAGGAGAGAAAAAAAGATSDDDDA